MSEIIPNLPFKDYCERPGINGSLLKIVHKKSLLHARAYLDGSYAEESDALDFGHCFHSLTLEGREDFVAKPETYVNDKGEEKPWNANANVCKKWLSEQGDLIPLNVETVTAVRTMATAAREGLASAINGQTEVSLFAEMKGHPVKCRVDLLPNDEDQPFIDLKSCQSAEPSKFLRNAIDLGYLIQAAFTIDVAKACGVSRDRFDLLAVESAVPHAICRLKFTDEPLSLLRLGRIHYRAAFQRLVNAQEGGRWEGYGQHAAEEFTPPWVLKELELTA